MLWRIRRGRVLDTWGGYDGTASRGTSVRVMLRGFATDAPIGYTGSDAVTSYEPAPSRTRGRRRTRARTR